MKGFPNLFSVQSCLGRIFHSVIAVDLLDELTKVLRYRNNQNGIVQVFNKKEISLKSDSSQIPDAASGSVNGEHLV